MSSIQRRLRPLIENRLRHMPGVVLLGPRQVGKTTLAREIAARRRNRAVYLDLERPADQRRLADADAFLRAQAGKLVVLDGIHRAPAIFGTLRGIIDERRAAGDRTGHFLLLGSAAIDLMRQASETLAGRVDYMELAPIDALELPNPRADIRPLWVRGGFPESLLASDDEASLRWRRSFIRSYLERDVPMFAPRLPAETIGRLWTMLAHAQGTPLNQSRLASSLAISTPAIGRYIDLLVDLLLVRASVRGAATWASASSERRRRTFETAVSRTPSSISSAGRTSSATPSPAPAGRLRHREPHRSGRRSTHALLLPDRRWRRSRPAVRAGRERRDDDRDQALHSARGDEGVPPG